MAGPQWVNNGSYQDLSDLADNSLTASSMAGGNMTSSNRTAMTAPGSPPVDPLVPAEKQDDPAIKMGSEMPIGTDGKPQASGETSYTPVPVRWGRTSKPQVVRGKPVNVPGADI